MLAVSSLTRQCSTLNLLDGELVPEIFEILNFCSAMIFVVAAYQIQRRTGNGLGGGQGGALICSLVLSGKVVVALIFFLSVPFWFLLLLLIKLAFQYPLTSA